MRQQFEFFASIFFFNFHQYSSFFFFFLISFLTPTQAERALELVRSGLKAVLTMNRLDEISVCRRWTEFMDRLTLNSATSEILSTLTLQQERGSDVL